MDPTCLWDHRVPRQSGELRISPHHWLWELGLGGGWGLLVECLGGKSAVVRRAWCGVRRGPRRLCLRRLAAGEHSREAGVGPAPRGRERGLLWKRFCIRIKS